MISSLRTPVLLVAEVRIDKGTWYRGTLRKGKSELVRRLAPETEQLEKALDDYVISGKMTSETYSLPGANPSRS
jgi:hypothetical protein